MAKSSKTGGSGGRDGADLQRRESLSMARLAPVALAPPVLEDGDLLAQALLDYLGLHRDPRPLRLADAHVAAVVGEQKRVEVDLGPRGAVELLDAQGFSLRDPVLLATSFNYGVHQTSLRR